MTIRNNNNNYRRVILNEAVQRTIDPKLWASVSSGISRVYKHDLGDSAKPIGTRDQLLQRYIAGLIILKQQCPMSIDELKNSKAFPQWGAKLVEMGVTIDEVQKLWNENCGKLPPVPVNASNINIEDDEDDEDELDFALGMTNDEYQANKAAKRAEREQQIASQHVMDNEDDIENIEPDVYRKDNINQNSNEFAVQSKTVPVTNHVKNKINDIEPKQLIEPLYDGVFNSKKFPELHGCLNPNDAIKIITINDLYTEKIRDCENLDDFKTLMNDLGVCFAMRVFLGGDPEEVKGDVVWCDAPVETSYYIAVGNNNIGIYYKDANGIFTRAYYDTLTGFGLSL